MAFNEIFPRPTVKQVIFQIRFPHLFSMESLIGEYQLRVMEHFPQSQLIMRQNLFIADVGSEGRIELPQQGEEHIPLTKIWRFESAQGVELNVRTGSLAITSTAHKTYSDLRSPDKFRDAIQSALDPFFEVTRIPRISRLGLRYVDECPVERKDNEWFQQWYNSGFPLERFPLSDATEMWLRATVRKGEHLLRYMANLQEDEERCKLILDFDAFATDVDSREYLPVTDKLHDLIGDAFEESVREPFVAFMRGTTEISHG